MTKAKIPDQEVIRRAEEAGLVFSEDKRTLLECRKAVGNAAVPEGVTEIGESAFEGRGSLSGVSLPDSVVRIGADAFAGCSHLRKLILPAGVAAIGAGAFAGVQEIVSESAKFPVDGSGILLDAEEKRILYAPRAFRKSSTVFSQGSWTKSAWKSASSRSRFYGMNRKSFSASSNAPQLLAVGEILPPFFSFQERYTISRRRL